MSCGQLETDGIYTSLGSVFVCPRHQEFTRVNVLAEELARLALRNYLPLFKTEMDLGNRSHGLEFTRTAVDPLWTIP